MKRGSILGAYLAAFSILLLIEVLIAVFVRDRFVRPYLGDALVIPVLYCLIRAFWSRPPRLLPLWVFLFAALVELGQLFGLVERLHLERSAILRIALGSTFDPADILCYAAGALLLFAWQAIERRRAAGQG